MGLKRAMKSTFVAAQQRLFRCLSAGLLVLGMSASQSQAAVSGWTILHEQSPGAQQVQLQWVVRSGSLEDGPLTSGLARFTARALLRGTTTRPYSDLSQALQTISATVRVEITQEFTRFICSVPANRLDSFLHLMRDIFSNPEFDPFEIESLRRDLLSELQGRQSDASSRLKQAGFSEFYSGTSAQNPPEGTADGLNRITGLDIRKFFKRHYGISNYVLALATPFPDGDLRFKLSLALRGVPDVAAKVQVLPPPTAQGLSAVVISDLSATDVPFLVVVPGVAAQDSDRPGLELTNLIFGIGPNSRLARFSSSLNGWLSEATSDFRAMTAVSLGAGAFSIQGRSQRAHLSDTVPAVFSLFQQFLQEGVSEAELISSREDYLSSLTTSLDSPEKRMAFRLDALLSGSALADLPSWQAELGKWDHSSASLSLKSRLSVNPAVVVIQGDPSQIVPVLQSIPGMGSIRIVDR